MKFGLFINKNFFLLWSGKIISQIGDKFYAIALAWWIIEKTGSPVIMGVFLACSMLPGLVMGVLAGPVIDRRSRKSILVAADIARGSIVLGVSILSILGGLEIWHVIGAAVFISLASAFFDPSVQAVIPQIVDKEQLPKANALNQTVGGICTIIGPVLGAAFVSFTGFDFVFLINSASYFASAILEGFLEIKPSNHKNSESTLLREIKDGLCFLASQKRIMIIIVTIAAAHFFMGSLMVSLPFMAKGIAGSGIDNLGYLEMMMGIGLMAGSIYIGIRNKGKLKDFYLFIFLLTIGICFLFIGIMNILSVKALIPYLAVMFLFGVAVVNASVFWQSLLQLNTPECMAGRVFSLSTMAGNISLPLAFVVFGTLLGFQPLSRLMLVSGSALAVISLLLLISYNNIASTVNDPNTSNIL